jgi:hypothetical protein
MAFIDMLRREQASPFFVRFLVLFFAGSIHRAFPPAIPAGHPSTQECALDDDFNFVVGRYSRNRIRFAG